MMRIVELLRQRLVNGLRGLGLSAEGRSQRLGITMSTAAHTMQRPPYSL